MDPRGTDPWDWLPHALPQAGGEGRISDLWCWPQSSPVGSSEGLSSEPHFARPAPRNPL